MTSVPRPVFRRSGVKGMGFSGLGIAGLVVLGLAYVFLLEGGLEVILLIFPIMGLALAFGISLVIAALQVRRYYTHMRIYRASKAAPDEVPEGPKESPQESSRPAAKVRVFSDISATTVTAAIGTGGTGPRSRSRSPVVIAHKHVQVIVGGTIFFGLALYALGYRLGLIGDGTYRTGMTSISFLILLTVGLVVTHRPFVTTLHPSRGRITVREIGFRAPLYRTLKVAELQLLFRRGRSILLHRVYSLEFLDSEGRKGYLARRLSFLQFQKVLRHLMTLDPAPAWPMGIGPYLHASAIPARVAPGAPEPFVVANNAIPSIALAMPLVVIWAYNMVWLMGQDYLRWIFTYWDGELIFVLLWPQILLLVAIAQVHRTTTIMFDPARETFVVGEKYPFWPGARTGTYRASMDRLELIAITPLGPTWLRDPAGASFFFDLSRARARRRIAELRATAIMSRDYLLDEEE